MGLTALSVEINMNLFTPLLRDSWQIILVDNTLFIIPTIGFFSTKGTCLYAAAWKTVSTLCSLNALLISFDSVHDPKIEIKDLWPDGVLEPVSFSAYKGEILGLSGQLGSGAGEILASIAGALKSRSGSLTLNGETFLPKSPSQAIKKKIAYCFSY